MFETNSRRVGNEVVKSAVEVAGSNPARSSIRLRSHVCNCLFYIRQISLLG